MGSFTFKSRGLNLFLSNKTAALQSSRLWYLMFGSDRKVPSL